MRPPFNCWNWAIKVCFGRTKFDRSSDLKYKYNILPVNCLLDFNAIAYLLKFVHKQIPALLRNPVFAPLQSIYQSERTKRMFFKPLANSKLLDNSIFKRTLTLWSNLPASLRCDMLSLPTFKKQLKTHLLDRFRKDPNVHLHTDVPWNRFRFGDFVMFPFVTNKLFLILF